MAPRNAPRDLRASDADRERVLALLAEAVGDGRLTAEEHAQRAESASSARTLGELAGLTSDLVTADAQPLQLDGSRPVAAIFGNQRREGRWVVPDRLAVAAVFGEAVLDMRAALLQSQHITIYATVVCGRLRLLVPAGVAVRVTAPSLVSRERGTTLADTGGTGYPSAPGGQGPAGPPGGGTADAVIEVRGVILLGEVQVRTPGRGRFGRIFGRRAG